MTDVTKTYPIADKELADLLAEAASTGSRVRVAVDGTTYLLEVTPDAENIWADYDPARVRQALDEYAGSWSDLDAEELKRTLYEARKVGSQPQDQT